MRRSIVLLVFVMGLIIIGSAPAAGNTRAQPGGTGDYIVVLNDSVADPGAVASQHGKALGGRVSQVYRHALNGYAVTLSRDKLSALEANPLVRFVSEDGEVRATEQILPSGIDRIDGDRSSTRSGNGRGSVGINIAVLDSGIDLYHPDLNLSGGIDCVKNNGNFDDPNGHGTHVAGTIGAKDDSVGVVGVAPGVRLWAVRVLNKLGSGSTSTVLCGVDFVTSTHFDSDPTNDIAVANMSLAGKGSDDGNCGGQFAALHRAICNSVAAGVTYVVAAGNTSSDFQNFIPAAYDEVLTVTAMFDFDGQPGGLSSTSCFDPWTAFDDTAASFSNFATVADDQAHTVAAPGACIQSTFPYGVYAVNSGTSMASPHAAGTVGLCIASGPCAGLTPAQIIEKIVADAAAYSNANTGYGFAGDPLRPVAAKYYGYLIRAAAY